MLIRMNLFLYSSENIAFTRIELEEITDEDENDKRSPTSNIQILSTVEPFDEKSETSLERFANRFVDSILNDVIHSEKFHPDDQEKNHGVRELSDDENALRELDENEMSGTDEFILFATNPDDDDDDENKNLYDDYPISPTMNRGNLNRLYTFTRSNEDGTTYQTKKSPSNQVRRRSTNFSNCVIFSFALIAVLNLKPMSIEEKENFRIW